ncbi:hypothetical protein DIPPA_09684 [Diplonema papillatum]|nr:hypothetical protein DIPPA_09684 [Diplonema papillatum]
MTADDEDESLESSMNPSSLSEDAVIDLAALGVQNPPVADLCIHIPSTTITSNGGTHAEFVPEGEIVTPKLAPLAAPKCSPSDSPASPARRGLNGVAPLLLKPQFGLNLPPSPPLSPAGCKPPLSPRKKIGSYISSPPARIPSDDEDEDEHDSRQDYRKTKVADSPTSSSKSIPSHRTWSPTPVSYKPIPSAQVRTRLFSSEEIEKRTTDAGLERGWAMAGGIPSVAGNGVINASLLALRGRDSARHRRLEYSSQERFKAAHISQRSRSHSAGSRMSSRSNSQQRQQPHTPRKLAPEGNASEHRARNTNSGHDNHDNSTGNNTNNSKTNANNNTTAQPPGSSPRRCYARSSLVRRPSPHSPRLSYPRLPGTDHRVPADNAVSRSPSLRGAWDSGPGARRVPRSARGTRSFQRSRSREIGGIVEHRRPARHAAAAAATDRALTDAIAHGNRDAVEELAGFVEQIGKKIQAVLADRQQQQHVDKRPKSGSPARHRSPKPRNTRPVAKPTDGAQPAPSKQGDEAPQKEEPAAVDRQQADKAAACSRLAVWNTSTRVAVPAKQVSMALTDEEALAEKWSEHRKRLEEKRAIAVPARPKHEQRRSSSRQRQQQKQQQQPSPGARCLRPDSELRPWRAAKKPSEPRSRRATAAQDPPPATAGTALQAWFSG